jgi:3'-phosphoadenosine 5'-phosphosulfate sulfotransferase (PAPS reductase)/FAD synthetase
MENALIQERGYALKIKQSLPLSDKIELSLRRIKEFYDYFGGNVLVSYSGGKDSSVLLWLVRNVFPDVKGLFCNTGLEYPEIVNHVKATPNIITIRPKKTFKDVIDKHGWPMISKQVANMVRLHQNPTPRNERSRIASFGKGRFALPKVWQFLIDAPFKISDQCCYHLKKTPFSNTGKAHFTGILAEEGRHREWSYIQNGCNVYIGKQPRSNPMIFWTQQDILSCIKLYNIPIAVIYGAIVTGDKGLQVTGIQRTGCIFCCFGLRQDETPNRFELLAQTHPGLYDYVANRLGLKEVFSWCKQNAPAKVRNLFRI